MLVGPPGRLLYFEPPRRPNVLASPLITPTNMALDPQTREVFITSSSGRISAVRRILDHTARAPPMRSASV